MPRENWDRDDKRAEKRFRSLSFLLSFDLFGPLVDLPLREVEPFLGVDSGCDLNSRICLRICINAEVYVPVKYLMRFATMHVLSFTFQESLPRGR